MSNPAPPELTPRAIILAIILAMILAGANAYLGLFAGMTIASAIPAAVVSMAVLKLLGGGHILENNIVATGASAGTSIATGVIFTLPALLILGYWQDFRYSWVLAIAGLGGLMILLVGGLLVVSNAITLGTFVAFSGYLTMLVWPMIAIGWVMNITERGLASMQRIDDVMAEAPEIEDAPETERVAESAIAGSSIRFEHVSFSYGGGREPVLHDVNFDIGAGETVAVGGLAQESDRARRDLGSGAVRSRGRDERVLLVRIEVD